ncbi:MAG: tRNA 4-thiouridine(8) synthase ThiI [Halanaerobiales bacterium]|nr:tRNA 4-thiouridine(8) synthase ThiI [Halanaerobiales bacterium]
MNKLYLIRYGEIALKGENRSLFENKLLSNIKKSLENTDKNLITYKTPGRIFLKTSTDQSVVIDRLLKIAGIVSFSPVLKLSLNYNEMKKETLKIVKNTLEERENISFRITARRSNKKYKYDSMELQYKLGEYVIENVDQNKIEVDLHQPELNINVEIRKHNSYIYSKVHQGIGGLPVGVTGNVGLMLSGGIDSPVAGYMGIKRGAKIIPVYFHSFPFTGDKTKQKVIELANVLANYQNNIDLYVVNFTDILQEINKKCPNKLMTIIMRRLMLKITELIIEKKNGKAIITGESIGQVASQTLDAIRVTNPIPKLPILRPLLGLNKVQIINMAKKIGTYDISIQPYEDCCSIFVPYSPETHPKMEQIKKGEETLDVDDLIKKAVNTAELINIEAY